MKAGSLAGSLASSGLFDSHCHLDFAAFDPDREAVLDRARLAGVGTILVPGYAPSTWAKQLALRARAPERLRLALGVHPYALADLEEGSLSEAFSQLNSLLERDSRISVGECGLDRGVERRGEASMERQVEVLEGHLELARAHDRPVILHVLGAHGRALAALRRYAPLRGALHSYSGSAELVREYAALGLSFGFSSAIAREGARRPREAARATPRDRLLVETDAPDQSLRRGAEGRARGEPAELPQILEALAEARGEAAEEVARITSENARALFG